MAPYCITLSIVASEEDKLSIRGIMRAIVANIGRRNLLDNRAFGSTGGEDGIIAVVAASEAKGLAVRRVSHIVDAARKSTLLGTALACELANENVALVVAITEVGHTSSVLGECHEGIGPPSETPHLLADVGRNLFLGLVGHFDEIDTTFFGHIDARVEEVFR